MNDKIRDLKIRLMLEAEKELTEDLTEAQRYQYYLGRMQFLHYVSGKENLLEAVCEMSLEFVSNNAHCFDIQDVMVFIAIVA